MSEPKEEELIVDEYGDHEVKEYENVPVPTFLKIAYLFFFVVGAAMLVYFWNGSAGYFDRGYWKELQIAAGTTRDSHLREVTRPTQ